MARISAAESLIEASKRLWPIVALCCGGAGLYYEHRHTLGDHAASIRSLQRHADAWSRVSPGGVVDDQVRAIFEASFRAYLDSHGYVQRKSIEGLLDVNPDIVRSHEWRTNR